MPEASYDPVRLSYHGWKKRLVGPIERFFLRRVAVVVAACEAEAEWIRAYEPRVKKIEVTDVKRFFRIENGELRIENARGLHLLYLGRRHPLKGVEYLERALRELGGQKTEDRRQMAEDRGQSMGSCCELRVVSDAFGEEKERVWEWCDVLVLPTLSENFGRVVAEALERGKRVITTDGAPAWQGYDYGGRLRYLVGYRDGTREMRVKLLKEAIKEL
jgi:glycosyltransferase involved in cell wall biosynthesis